MDTKRHGVLHDESGVALLTVLGVGLVITILAIGSFTLARQSLNEASLVEDDTQAFRAASSGMERVLSTFSEAQAVTMLAGEPIEGSTPDGEYVVTIEDLPDNEWVLTAVGTGPDGEIETVQQRFYFLDLWKMNLSTGSDSLMSGSSGLHGTSSIVGPFYMKGDLEIQANMAVLEGPLFVKDGIITVKNQNSWLGMVDKQIKVYCDGSPPSGGVSIPLNTGTGSGKGTGVYVSSRVLKVPDIQLPPLTQAKLNEWAEAAKRESVDNIMGTTTLSNLESSDGSADSYETMRPPNTATWSRSRAKAGSSLPYKFIGSETGAVSDKGEGTTNLVIGGRDFGSWGSVSTADGVSITGPGPAGAVSYTADRWDDFAYDNTRNILYISGTVFVDGDVTFNEDMRYVGNGTIVANGDIVLNGDVLPYGTNANGETNEWALGLVTPGNLTFTKGGSNPMSGTGASNREALRTILPNYAGAFYVEKTATFDGNNMLVRGTVLAGQMEFPSNNCLLVTNPLLPSYLPDSLPGAGTGFLSPGLWSRL